MKRLHVHLRVDHLEGSIDFYTTLFGSAPTLVKHDYAKWRIDDPRVNFTISQRNSEVGVDHLGIEVDSAAELATITARLADRGGKLVEQKDTRCCYARSDKTWASDPQGIVWEAFRTQGPAALFGAEDDTTPSACGTAGDCDGVTAAVAAAARAESCCADAPCGTPSAAHEESACCA